MNAEVIGQAVLFQVHVDGKVEQQLQQKCCLPNEVALNEKGKLRKLFCKHLADCANMCKHNCHGETTPQDRSHSKNKDWFCKFTNLVEQIQFTAGIRYLRRGCPFPIPNFDHNFRTA